MEIWKTFNYYSKNIAKDISFNILKINNNDMKIYVYVLNTPQLYVYRTIPDIEFKYLTNQDFRYIFKHIISTLEKHYIKNKEI